VFTRGTTESVNLVAHGWGRKFVNQGDVILLTEMEHHSNLVPWQLLAQDRGATLRFIPIDGQGRLDLTNLDRLLEGPVKIVSLAHVSNVLGTINPVVEIIRRAHARGARVMLDAAQSVPHMPVDVRALDCDFYVFSGHKAFGPTGIGILYGKEAWLERMAPYQGGGDMIKTVTFEKTTYNELPYKFEAGTPHIAGAIGLAAALDYLEALGLDRIGAWEHELLAHGTELLTAIPGVRLIGTARRKAAVLSFILDGIHPHDVGTILDHEGVAIRAGHHCAMPVMQRFGVPATARASLAFYNTPAELDALARAVRKARAMLGP
jgi:cysteine desulfurase/selenocysteine lyase